MRKIEGGISGQRVALMYSLFFLEIGARRSIYKWSPHEAIIHNFNLQVKQNGSFVKYGERIRKSAVLLQYAKQFRKVFDEDKIRDRHLKNQRSE